MLPEQQQRIMGYFIEEAKDHLNTIEQGLLNLQATIEDPEMANEVFRAAHSVKGGAAMLGIESVQRTAHRLEDYFKILKEAPVQTDRTLESMFLRVFDTLQELLDQLQGPFGLTEDKAQDIMTTVEPVFDQLNQHLNHLVQQQGAAAVNNEALLEVPTASAPVSAVVANPVADVEESALQLVFRSDVPACLRDILAGFKQPDQPSTRQTLQQLCQNLFRIGEQFDIVTWCDLVNTARLAISNQENTYRTLAPIIIREIKQGQEMVLAGRAAEISVSKAMQALLPLAPVDQPVADMSLDDLLEGSLEPSIVGLDLPDLFDAEDPGPLSDSAMEESIDWLEPSVEGTELAALELDSLAFASEGGLDQAIEQPTAPAQSGGDQLDSPRLNQVGPEVGTAELNSLADLFEGEVAGLDNAWQEEEIVEDVRLVGETMDIDISGDFSDLFLDEGQAAVKTPNFSSGDELADLFGESLLEEESSGAEQATSQPINHLDFSGLDDLSAESEGLSGANAAGGDDLDDLLNELATDNLAIAEGSATSPISPSTDSDPKLAGLEGLFGDASGATDLSDLSESSDIDFLAFSELGVTPADTAPNSALNSELADLWGDEAAELGQEIAEGSISDPIDLSTQDLEIAELAAPWSDGLDNIPTSARVVDNPDFESVDVQSVDAQLDEALAQNQTDGASVPSLANLGSNPEPALDMGIEELSDPLDSPELPTDSWDDLNLKALEAGDLGSLFEEFTAETLSAWAEASDKANLTDETDSQDLTSAAEVDITNRFFATSGEPEIPASESLEHTTDNVVELTDEFFVEEGAILPPKLDVDSPDDFFNVENPVLGEPADGSERVATTSTTESEIQSPELEFSRETAADSASVDAASGSTELDLNHPNGRLDDGLDDEIGPDLDPAGVGAPSLPIDELSPTSAVAGGLSDLENQLEVETPMPAADLIGLSGDEDEANLSGVEIVAQTQIDEVAQTQIDEVAQTQIDEVAQTQIDEFDDLERLLEEADQTLGGSSPSPGLRRTTTQASRRPLRRSMGVLGEQTMRVSVKHLDNLSNLVGELVVNRNTLEQDQERLRQFLDNLLFQVQQLNDVGQRMRDLYERSLLESSLISSRQVYLGSRGDRGGYTASHSTGETFDALEMDRFTGFHTLSQEMIELIVRVREASSDIAYTVESADQVTRQFRQVTIQLQEGLNKARMVPFAQTADRLPRAVRDISLKCGKEAKLVVEGRDTLIDKMILEQLYDPMTHLVNNAITHGVETPQERIAANKAREGKITVRAFYQGNQTVIYVADDGAGIDDEFVKGKAIQKGLISSTEARNMSMLDIYELLFHPGFSTRDEADDFAGRGVGMDVVRTSLSEIRGSVTIDSELGKGTSFTIRLPLTLSISKALSCISNQARIAFPMDGVEDMFDVPKDRIQTNQQGQSCILWRDTLLPFQPLSDLLKFNRTLGRGRVYGGNQDDEVISIVVLRSASTHIALQVDQVIGEQEIVIKQLEGPVPKPIGIAGATVLGDGRVMPIADVLELIDLSMGRVRREPSASLWAQPEDAIPVEAVVVKTEPTVLIVDDSITVRELLSMSFGKVGYRVEQARDGQEAWEKLRSGLPCDLVFCDIEMPRMDGLELLSRIQKDANLKRIPIAMLTSRGADRHRQMAVDLGASGYFTKPYLEEALLDAAQRMLNGEPLIERRDPGE